MDFTVICPNCGARLRLFDAQVKRRKGAVRCTRCGCRIPYDLSQPRPQRTGYWPETEVPFKPGAQKKFLSLAKARQNHPDFQLRPLAEGDAQRFTRPAQEGPRPARVPPAFDRAQNGFKAFDLKTGRVLDDSSPLSQSLPEKPRRPVEPPAPRNIPKAAPRRRAAPRPPARETLRAAAAPASRTALRAPGMLSRLRSFFLRFFRK